MEVFVNGNGPWAVDKALTILKRKLSKEGVLREWKRHVSYEPPSARRKRKHAEAERRRAKERRRVQVAS
ncbi:MAG TPA: 30S ribosomal protein S21 [Candidatus Binatus sp.]|uniref:30S ribosomal protein S21 n=1 Tax=Candidatus Binatus sp. TaxID=2811406 RepID=UPI002B470432|nr:30S ribosomal protein S21 [Candidatus Binatus sp.]HKN13400.1 30S ribosomal protein S21 [Candidatus Binatus sp.]